MAIDGIGQGSGAPKVGGAAISTVGGPDGTHFELPTEAADRASGAEGTKGADLLDRVQRGEVRLDAYLDVRVDDAVGHLEGKLSPEQLEFVKEELREQLRSDPVLMELVRRTTGQSPQADEP
jgi:hypothetical protein